MKLTDDKKLGIVTVELDKDTIHKEHGDFG